MEYQVKICVLRIPSLVIGSTWIFSPWKNSLRMSLVRCVFHHIVATYNIFPVCCRAKLKSIRCRSICDSLPSNRHHRGYKMNQSLCNKPNGEVSLKSTKDLIAFSHLVSAIIFPVKSIPQKTPSIRSNPMQFNNIIRDTLQTFMWYRLQRGNLFMRPVSYVYAAMW